MSLKYCWIAVSLAASASCALLPGEPPAERDGQADLDSFVQAVREDLEEHAWQSLLAASDPVHYQAEVVVGGVEEVRYLAELFGLTREGNNIQEGDTLDWEDLERTEAAALAPVAGQEAPYRVTGFVTLESGEELDLETWVTRVQGRFVLTGAP